MSAAIGMTMLAGGMIGAGISGYSGAQSACNNAKSALSMLQEVQSLQGQWNSVLTQETILDDAVMAEMSQSYQNISNLQATIQQNQTHSRKQKTIIITIGVCVIVGIFFCLLTKYFLKKYLPLAVASNKKNASHVMHKS